MVFLNRIGNWQALTAHAATFAAAIFLAWIAASWTWHWSAPRPLPAAEIESSAPPPTEINWFGAAPQTRTRAQNEIGVLGIIAANRGGEGYAIVRVADRPAHPVKEGGEIEPGIRLIAIHTDTIEITRGSGSGSETLALPVKTQTSTALSSPSK